MSEITVNDGVLRYTHSHPTRWLSTGWQGGYHDSPAAYNVSVPEQWERVDLDAYAATRRERAGFDGSGPTLFTGVDLRHARRARCGAVEAVVTAGVSNPAALPAEPPQRTESRSNSNDTSEWRPGTVNIILATTEALTDGALATLLACVVEAKAATLLSVTEFPGTTTDAVVVGCEQIGGKRPFAGSATTIGAAARACVRDGVRASLASRYAETPLPDSVATAQYGVTTTRRADVSKVNL